MAEPSSFRLPLPPAVERLLGRFDRAGAEVWLVGGCLRDSLLGRPVHDWDLCCGLGTKEIRGLFGDCVVLPTGEKHGTVTLLWEGEPYEISMYRRERDYDGRRPAVVEAAESIEEDLARRDFTVNALAYHPGRGLLDCWGGREDLACRLLRAVGREPEERFREDALRILRGLRFGAVYGFTLEEKTASAMAAQAEGLRKLSGERVWQEVCRLLPGDWAGEILARYGALLRGLGGGWEGFSFGKEEAALLGVLPSGGAGRLALLLRCCGAGKEKALAQLRCPRKVREAVERLWAQERAAPKLAGRLSLCRWLAAFPAGSRVEEARCALLLSGEERRWPEVEELLAQGLPLDLGQLALKGKDLVALGYEGPELGRQLRLAQEAVWLGCCPNEATALGETLAAKEKIKRE